MILTYAAVMAGGALGVGARMALAEWMTFQFGTAFPWGTFTVNVLGCFLIGVVSGLTGPEGWFAAPPIVRQVIMIGFLGGFTTFSSFSIQTLELISEGQWLYAMANVVFSVVLCLLATLAGLALTAALSPD